MITIKMPKESLEKWLAALRSGEYEQGRSQLRSRNRFCCLGVLQHCISGQVEMDKQLPSIAWLRAYNIIFKSDDGSPAYQNSPYLPSLRMGAARANDNYCSFNQIADAIEKCSEGF